MHHALHTVLGAGAIILALASRAPAHLISLPQPPTDIAPQVRDAGPLLAPIIEKHKVPGMAVLLLKGDRIWMAGVAGVRVRGREEKITLEDKFHLGSCTKAMTATLCAMLVENGTLAWNDTLGQRFGTVKPMDEGFSGATLEQLLHNRAGVPGSLDADGLWAKLWAVQGTPTEARQLLLAGVVARKPSSPPGTKEEYSNGGFSIAGLMAETAAGKPYEQLLDASLFKPLQSASAGFGPPGEGEKQDPPTQPWGHGREGKPKAPGPGADNPPAVTPAGRVHMTIGDWSRFAALHLRGHAANPNRAAALLKPESFDTLHTPWAGAAQGYAKGWIVGTRPWAKGSRESDRGVVLTHGGSNTMWHCVVWIAPERDFAVLACCNQGPGGDRANDEAVGALIREFQKADNAEKRD